VVIHDHRGTGESSRSRIRYSVDQMTDDLLAVMDDLRIVKAHLVGHSTGGAIGQTMAASCGTVSRRVHSHYPRRVTDLHGVWD
jgi:aminoacrylate hydrolase